jgi:fibro-slime domain-containing protein
VISGSEVCDDENDEDGDGCSAQCDAIEPYYVCPTQGEPCISTIECGDNRISPGEECDDGNSDEGDGCDDTCQLEAGYSCPIVGEDCVVNLFCGDGKISGLEQCDDENNDSGDGCTAECQREPFYDCSTPGELCHYTVVCGDGRVQDQETCDDENDDAGDGCSANCTLEDGWKCPVVGLGCEAALCNDGIIAGNEECEDGNADPGDGCDENCKVEDAYACVNTAQMTPPSVCHLTVCNDGVKEGSEPCDDGNQIIGDGCSPYCEVEPNCPPTGGACSSRCGDGLILPGDDEECDDGNTKAGDGCSADCKVEEGYECTVVQGELPASITIPFVFRDFIALPSQTTALERHPDFEAQCLNQTDGVVEATLDDNGKPVNTGTFDLPGACAINVDYLAGDDCGVVRQTCNGGCGCTGSMGQTHGNHPIAGHPGDPFQFWYRDTAGVNITDVQPITLTRGVGDIYQYDSGGLFPLDGAGWVASGDELTSAGHNFGFTSEVRRWFQFQGGETLTFAGDDDVWVFVNGKLALDLGGLHSLLTRTIRLEANGTVSCKLGEPSMGTPFDNLTNCSVASRNVGTTVGEVYEITLFHAERHTTASNFRLAIGGFVSATSSCESVCGDGIVTKDEVCDDGVNNGSYGGCMPGCQARAPYCGDGDLDVGHEQCDDGINLSQYGGCAPGCVNGPFCGDGALQPIGGEQCDDGNNDGGYGECAPSCQLGPRCGDGDVQDDEGEQCDDGLNAGGYGQCGQGCKLGPRCGDGAVQEDENETCDDGINDGAYGGCTPGCKLGPRCGDGVRQSSEDEECDDGSNMGGYGECAPGCKLGPRCGDGVRQASNGEQCDDGSNMGGYGKCAAGCKLGPRCGDGVRQASNGEQCDDGNTKSRDGCSSTCKKEDIVK